MSLSIADIDNWSPEALSAVGAASTARANAASQGSSRLGTLSAFDHWKGASAGAAQARTAALANGLNQHGQTASMVATAANTAANEVRQIKTQLGELRSTLGQYSILVDANSSRAVPAVDVSSLPPAKRQLVENMTTVGQQSLDKLRQAADLADAHLAAAVSTQQDDFNLDTQYSRPGGGVAKMGIAESSVECGNYVTGLTAITLTYLTVTSQCCGGKD